ncbi:MAG: FeoA family protein [Gammaproteobacteria bacterium]
MVKKLIDLAPGESGEVAELLGDPAVNQRLMHMGIVEGANIKLIRKAPSGDPIEISVMDYALSLRVADASRIIISV